MSDPSLSILETAPRPISGGKADALRQQAWANFQRLPQPSRKLEAWRFADLAKLDFSSFQPATPAADPQELVERSVGLHKTAGRLVFVNDVLVHQDSSLRELGLEVVGLEQAPDTARAALETLETRLGSDKYAALHQAHVQAATVVCVPRGLELNAPLEIFHWASGNAASVFPRTLILAEAQSQVSVFEHHLSAVSEQSHFSCGATQIHAQEDARVDYVLLQQRSLSSKHLHLTTTHCAEKAHITTTQIGLGSAWSRGEAISHLEGPHSRSDMLGLALTSADQESDHRTLQLHHAPHTQSDLLYKNVLFGQSRCIFAGLIVVDEGAHFTDAYQTCRNLLMTDTCEANAMPGLEINADQVKCSHGSTTGAISPEEIFYLESRGIPEAGARALLARGFLAQTLDRLKEEEIRQYILAKVDARFAEVLA